MAGLAGAALFVVYACTLAPGVTFWDAGEFIAAARVFGIPHPPGTPLFVALGRVWIMALGGMLGVARASNLLSATSTACAGALMAWTIAWGTKREIGARWGALTAALCAGLATSVWANATETEVYAASLLHVMVMLACALRASDDADAHSGRWLMCLAYLIALAPAVHLSALVGAPAAILLASRRSNGVWRVDRALLLTGVLVAAAGVGRMSWMLVGVGALLTTLSVVVPARARPALAPVVAPVLAACALVTLASSALLILLLRARHDPAVNQGNPNTLTALADVVARRQYDVSPLWPRQAPVWLQLTNVAQYADWQFAFAWGNGVFTTPARVLVALIFAVFAGVGLRALRRDSPRIADALLVLGVCGSIGVVTYLNLKAGASIGYGFVPGGAHEARERDYFFVLAFWAWGALAGYGAFAVIRGKGWPMWLAMGAALVPLLGNWTANDRSRGAEAGAARAVALGLLNSAPSAALLFLAGDNDTYPLWYAQQVEHIRTDVTLVTFPLLPADWYPAEIARRTGLHWPRSEYVEGARWSHEEQAALIARAARAAGRPVAASVALGAHERSLLGSGWRLNGLVYVSGGAAGGPNGPPEMVATELSGIPALRPEPTRRSHLPDDVTAMMLGLFECRRLATLPTGRSPGRDSLETRCNLR
ncbi:MAG: DUF2723 domain-containing protein [bacterium]